jgi:signal transduction histidine kinase
MDERARRLGGHFDAIPGASKGTILTWRAPLRT